MWEVSGYAQDSSPRGLMSLYGRFFAYALTMDGGFPPIVPCVSESRQTQEVGQHFRNGYRRSWEDGIVRGILRREEDLKGKGISITSR